VADNLLSVVEAGERLGITPSALRRLIRAGRMAARQVGRAYVIDERALVGYTRGRGGRPRGGGGGRDYGIQGGAAGAAEQQEGTD
jgi:excisionase family DNA binding protein